jgi:hypothetical protein
MAVRRWALDEAEFADFQLKGRDRRAIGEGLGTAIE